MKQALALQTKTFHSRVSFLSFVRALSNPTIAAQKKAEYSSAVVTLYINLNCHKDLCCNVRISLGQDFPPPSSEVQLILFRSVLICRVHCRKTSKTPFIPRSLICLIHTVFCTRELRVLYKLPFLPMKYTTCTPCHFCFASHSPSWSYSS